MICPFRATTALFSASSHQATQAKLFLFSIYLVLIYSIKLLFIKSQLHVVWWCHVLTVHPHQKKLYCKAREYFTIKFCNNSLNRTVTGKTKGDQWGPRAQQRAGPAPQFWVYVVVFNAKHYSNISRFDFNHHLFFSVILFILQFVLCSFATQCEHTFY